MSAAWITRLTENDGRLYKENIIKQVYEAALLGNEISQRFLNGLKYCYDPYITFGVKQIPETSGIVDAENPWLDFAFLLDRLASHQLSGNAARDAIQSIAHRFDSDEWNTFLAPILRRDMRAGISEKTINKIVKGSIYEIPKFGCQLATNCEGRPEMKGVKRLDPKLDGVRVLMVVSERLDSIISYSRNGKVFDNFKHIENQIFNSLTQIFKNGSAIRMNSSINLYDGFVLDGEVVGNSFQELMRQARRKTDVQADDSVYHIFDIIPLDSFMAGKWDMPLSERMSQLNLMRTIIDEDMPNVELVPHIEVNLDTPAGIIEFNTYCTDMVAAGFEGVMIKDLEAPYECDRSLNWMKYKPTLTVDLEVIGMEEGTGRNKGRLGALVCSGIDRGKEITVNVGSGYSDADRTSYWNNKELIIGSVAEILCDVITQNRDGTYSLRFPRFVRFRDDKEQENED